MIIGNLDPKMVGKFTCNDLGPLNKGAIRKIPKLNPFVLCWIFVLFYLNSSLVWSGFQSWIFALSIGMSAWKWNKMLFDVKAPWVNVNS